MSRMIYVASDIIRSKVSLINRGFAEYETPLYRSPGEPSAEGAHWTM